MKFGHLILWKIFKFVATSCQILRLKYTTFNFGWGSAPDPAGGAYSAPPHLGPTSKEGERNEWGIGGRDGVRGGNERGRKRRGPQGLAHIPMSEMLKIP